MPNSNKERGDDDYDSDSSASSQAAEEEHRAAGNEDVVEGSLVIEGQSWGKPQWGCMGTYAPSGSMVNGRPVYEQWKGFVLYYSSDGWWCITARKERAKEGLPSSGFLGVQSDASTPEHISAVWQVQVNGEWQSAPAVALRRAAASGEQKSKEHLMEGVIAQRGDAFVM